jgi:hypothetical protein
MQEAVQTRTPAHIWIVGILATLWNCFGAYDYIMTRTRNTDYLASMMQGVDPNEFLAWVDGYPIYAQIGWGLGVWGGLIGSVLLLLRSRWAVWAFALSLLGMLLSFGYAFFGPPMPGAEQMGAMNYFPLVIIAIGVALFLYARAQQQKGVLR